MRVKKSTSPNSLYNCQPLWDACRRAQNTPSFVFLDKMWNTVVCVLIAHKANEDKSQKRKFFWQNLPRLVKGLSKNYVIADGRTPQMITVLLWKRGGGMFWPKDDSITEGSPANDKGLSWILRKYSRNMISENVTKFSIFPVVQVRPNYHTYFCGDGGLWGPPKVIKCNSWT